MEKVKKTTFFTAKNVTYLAVLVALVIVLQMCGSFIKIGTTTFAFVLVPIALGGMLMGVAVGAALGALFGILTIVTGLMGLEPFTLWLLQANPVATVIICLLKGTLAGTISAILYKVISKKNKYVAVFVASAIVPIVNTGVFIIGGYCIIDTICAVVFGTALGETGYSATYIIFVLLVGVNFFVEFATSLICSPALYSVNKVLEKQIAKNSKKKKVKVNSSTTADLTENKENDNLS